MAKRLLTAAIGVPIAVIILILGNMEASVMAVVTDICSVMAVYEILAAAKYTKYRSVTVVSLLFSGLLPLFFCYDSLRSFAIPVAFLFLVMLCCAVLLRHKEIRFDALGLIALVSVCVPFAISTLAFFRFAYPAHGLFLMIYALGTTWLADGGAYFVGTFMGKHKLCPEISPKKTWEGFFGGMATAVLFAVISGVVYELCGSILPEGERYTVNILLLAVIAAISTALGLLGDLTASHLKRQCGVKDFGNIFPGHGGVMDRFDSVLFVAPFVYLTFKFIFPITLL